MTENNVQTLDKKQAKRGRPKREELGIYAMLWPGYTSRQTLYNKMNMSIVGVCAVDLGLADGDFRDKQTGKRLMTKFVHIGGLFGDAFWETDKGKAWLTDNWSQIVELRVTQIIDWVRSVKQG